MKFVTIVLLVTLLGSQMVYATDEDTAQTNEVCFEVSDTSGGLLFMAKKLQPPTIICVPFMAY